MLDFLLGLRKQYRAKPEFSVTVLVPAYNEEASVATTIHSLKKQTYPVDRILVIDDSSTDNTREVALIAGAEVVTTPSQTGTKAMAQNYALPMVTTDVVVTIDADTRLATDAIEHILPPLQDERIASVCGFVVPQKIETFWEKARYIEYLWGFTVVKDAQSSLGACMVSSGCFSAYRTEVLREFNGFPAGTVVEDMDLTWTQLEKGYRVVMAPKARCFPLDPSNYKTYQAQLDRWFRGYFQVLKSHKGDILKNKRLALFVLWSLLEGLSYPLTAAFIFAFFAGLPGSFAEAFTAIALAGAGIVIGAALIQAAMDRDFVKAAKCLPCYFIACPVSMYLFWRALTLECALGRRLTTWNKGH